MKTPYQAQQMDLLQTQMDRMSEGTRQGLLDVLLSAAYLAERYERSQGDGHLYTAEEVRVGVAKALPDELKSP
jgi:hypothetical protein